MSSAEKPASSKQQIDQQQDQKSQPDDTDLSKCEVAKLLEQKDREIHALKFELDKYKLALHQSQLGYRYFQQQQQIHDHESGTLAKDDVESLLESDSGQFDTKPALVSTPSTNENQAYLGDIIDRSIDEQRKRLVSGKSEEASDTAISESNVPKESSQSSRLVMNRHSTVSACSKVIFKSGIDDDDMENIGTTISTDDDRQQSISENNIRDLVSDDIQDIIQDIGEIDLDMEFDINQQRQNISMGGRLSDQMNQASPDEVSDVGDASEDEPNHKSIPDDEDMISDGLLTSLTDAAISNLSQLAALQERCESQQHPQYQQHSESNALSHTQPPEMNPNSMAAQAATSIPTPRVSASSSICLGPIGRSGEIQDPVGFEVQDRFTPSTRQAVVATMASKLQNTASMIGKTDSTSSSNSPSSTMYVEHGSNRSLASVVAAAAVAAAAANADQKQQNQHHRPSHQIQLTPQSRLISSALASSEFYHNLQQQHHHAQQTNLQHQMSPVSSLHFSPSTSITPSPSSLLGQSRRSASNTSSSLLSPIASPSYLRRQFLPDRPSMLSPSPTSLTTGSSSYNSSSLAHILQQHSHHSSQQQRSASALAGTITSPSGTPIIGTGSSTMSPLMSSKNSSQARLNNMQIRHKFGYLGSGRAQFNSPHGFCLGLDQEIVVADTNNHRVCIFDKSGTYITQFGSPGKEEGQLWNPRKVAILHRPSNSTNSASASQQSNRSSQGQVSTSYTNQFANEPLFVVCDRGAERSRMQLFTKDGAFIKKIGIHYIDIVAGLAITQDGLIIVVDSVSPTVYIINGETGSLNGWFDCSGHMKEPSDIAVKSDSPRNEYFICDFKGHCVVVFSEQGDYLRKIGHDGLTSYPNGIDISDDGDILVGDSHGNRFHVVVFDRNGNFVSQFECPHVKVSRCCGLKITREGYIVTLAKNNHHVLVLDTIHI